jgi:hypothetical protein
MRSAIKCIKRFRGDRHPLSSNERRAKSLEFSIIRHFCIKELNSGRPTTAYLSLALRGKEVTKRAPADFYWGCSVEVSCSLLSNKEFTFDEILIRSSIYDPIPIRSYNFNCPYRVTSDASVIVYLHAGS